jgi:hypothetical protein
MVHRDVMAWGARSIFLGLLLLLGGCAPAIIAGVIILLSQDSGSSGCTIPGSATDVTLHGTVRYQKRLDSQTGATGMVMSRNARIEVLQVNCGEKVIAATATDDQGFYTVTVSTRDGAQLKVSVVSELVDLSDDAVRATVKNNDRDRMLYSFEGSKITLAPGASQTVNQDIDIPIDCRAGVAGAFNLLEQLRRALALIEGTFPPPTQEITVLWELGKPDGTFFSLSSRDLDGDGQAGDPFIQLRGGLLGRSECQNTDQFDDGVVTHEFGHFVAFLHSRDDSPGGPHALAELIDPRLAYSEGWANFFSSMVRNDPILEDTCEDLANCSWPCGGSCGFEFSNRDPGAFCSGGIPSSCCLGIGSEDAVGGFLWSLFDPSGSIEISADHMLRAMERIKSQTDPTKQHFFVYVGDFIHEIEDLEPSHVTDIVNQAKALDLADSGGTLVPFPDPFPVEMVSGNSVHATTQGTTEIVNGCDVQACKVFAESFLGSSDFYRLDIPGVAGQGGTLTATLNVVSAGGNCNPDLELRIYNPSQTLVFTARIDQPGTPKSISFSLNSDFPRGAPFLFEVAGDIPPSGSEGVPGNVGEKANYVLTVDVH